MEKPEHPDPHPPTPPLMLRFYPDFILREVCEPVPAQEVAGRLKGTLADMLETMYFHNGAGLAAPQAGFRERFFVLDVSEKRNQPVMLVNPEIVESRGREVIEEGCLSVPEVRGKVKRSSWVKVRYLDDEGRPCEMEAEGLTARAIQHEMDHLNGVLFIDHLSTAKRLSIRKALRELEARYQQAAGD